MSTQITISGYQSQGQRPYQEDRYLTNSVVINDTQVHLLAVADGMGGQQAGDVAAELAINEIRTFFNELSTTDFSQINTLLEGAFFDANAAIREYASQHDETMGMGTTLTCAVVIDVKMLVAHIGDSRAYIISEESIYQCTNDHSARQEAINSGIDVSKINVGANALTRCLDGSEDFRPELSAIFDVGQSLVLVCSDGLHGSLSEMEIDQIARHSANANQFARTVVNKAQNYGASDNITVACVAFPGRTVYEGMPDGKIKKTGTKVMARVVLPVLVLALFSVLVFAFYNYQFGKNQGNHSVSDTLQVAGNINIPEKTPNDEESRNDENSEIVNDIGQAEKYKEQESDELVQSQEVSETETNLSNEPSEEETDEINDSGEDEPANNAESDAETTGEKSGLKSETDHSESGSGSETNPADERNNEDSVLAEEQVNSDTAGNDGVKNPERKQPEDEVQNENNSNDEETGNTVVESNREKEASVDSLKSEISETRSSATEESEGTGQEETNIFGLYGKLNEEASSGYCLQVGAYHIEENAINKKQELSKYRVNLIHSDVDGLWRVCVGQFETEEEANQAKKTMENITEKGKVKKIKDLQ